MAGRKTHIPRDSHKKSARETGLDRVHHVAIQVPDISQALEWYTSRFNCHVEYVDETWALLEFANAKLALVLPNEHPAHFAISRPDANKFGDLVTHRDGLKSVYISDTFGNSIEVLEKPYKR